MVSPFPYCPVNRECHVKVNPDRKRKKLLSYYPWQPNIFVPNVTRKVRIV